MLDNASGDCVKVSVGSMGRNKGSRHAANLLGWKERRMANNPKTYQFDLPSTGRPDDLEIPEKWYPGIKDYWKRSSSARIYNPIEGIRAIVIHATAGSS